MCLWKKKTIESIKCKLEMTANGLCYIVGVIIVCEKWIWHVMCCHWNDLSNSELEAW